MLKIRSAKIRKLSRFRKTIQHIRSLINTRDKLHISKLPKGSFHPSVIPSQSERFKFDGHEKKKFTSAVSTLKHLVSVLSWH